ncbi:hypothetical protein SteCoe_4377 [Stentor coeruleus]|uniref:Uncharacterized protein n=1 Tax=Stentor coeruleus TaxID=5963 RepID=A0A1R2CUP7_9CILI|nr:hypothetical protein SteCoe_4377 [Stentor coeruleus]
MMLPNRSPRFFHEDLKLPKLPKLQLSMRIGPTTRLSPPRNLSQNFEMSTKTILSPSFKPQDLIPSPSLGFLDLLAQKYSKHPKNECSDQPNKTPKTKPIIFSWTIKRTYGNTPASRVGGTLTVIGNDIYLFGGQSGDRLNELKCLKYDSLHWDTITTPKDLEVPEPRDGHITLPYKNYLVVYGGAGAFNTILHARTCSPLLHILDTQSLHWKTHKPIGRLPDPRRNHSAAIIGCTVIIYGGIGNDNNTLADFHGVNLDTMQWFTPKFSKDTVKPGPRHSFSMCSVYHQAMFKVNNCEIFNLPVIYDEDFTRKNCGIYIFGGMNGERRVLNDMFLLQTVKKNSKSDKNMLKIIRVEGSGKFPIARHGHSMGLCGKYVVIVGGRNDELYAGCRQSHVDEIGAFNITTSHWETVDLVGLLPISCWGVACATIGSKLLCFGGMNLSSFATNELWSLETNQDSIEGFELKKKDNPIRILIRRNTKYNL